MNITFENKVALRDRRSIGNGLGDGSDVRRGRRGRCVDRFQGGRGEGGSPEAAAAGHKTIAVRCDVSDDGQVAAMVERTLTEFGQLNAALNNAGVMARIAPTADSTREDWDRVIGINLRGRVELHEARTAAYGTSGQRCDRQQRVGRCIDRQPWYRFLHRVEARRCRPNADGSSRICQAGIRVNAVNPGLIDTQVARDVVNGNEQAYEDIGEACSDWSRGYAGGDCLEPCCGFAVRGRAMW